MFSVQAAQCNVIRPSSVPLDHAYSKINTSEAEVTVDEPKEIPAEVTFRLLLEAREKLLLCLPPFWYPIVDHSGVHVMLFSRYHQKSVQRTLYFSASGKTELSVHCKPVSIEPFLDGVLSEMPISENNVGEFCDRIIQIVAKVRLKEVCAGVDNSNYREVWSSLELGEVDTNPYQECRYTSTYRSLACSRLVDCGKWKCKECVQLTPFVRRRYEQMRKEAHPNTRNDFLSNDQKLKKIRNQRDQIERQRKKLDYQQQRMQFLLKKEGVNLAEDISSDLQEMLRSGNLSPGQSMFLQQQVKASQKKNMCGMRWHPSLIRIALSIYLNSRSTYEMIRDSGVIKLPSSRTLFDYSHADVVKEGIDDVILKDLSEKVGKFEENYKKYHVLMADEMYTSKNLVFHKQSGELRGYMKLNELDKEMKLLENFLDDPDKSYHPEQSSKILCFLVKGVCTSVKEVVATYAVSSVSIKQMYMWTWDVIGALERSGVWVCAFTCDGSSTNRSFIKMHTPVSEDKFLPESIPGNAIYATINKAAPHRVLYFISDVPHLLKTIRNCFNNSRRDKSKGKRCLKLNGQRIVWDTIIDLYNMKKGKMLRKSYKLNAQNVFPDSYSCMRVPLAAAVMSRTVSNDIEQQNWPNTQETVRFIRYVNDWFDCLNGAHTYHGVRKRNERLDPYKLPDDKRFNFLIDFVKYIDNWKNQAEKNPILEESIASNATLRGNESQCEDDPLIPVEDVDDLDETPAGKMQLSHQTRLGIEITVKSFISCTRFLLSEGCPFVNARVYCQDPLEQYFGKLRSGFGGSSNPNAGQCLHKQRTIHIQGELGVKRKGNTEGVKAEFQVTEEPLRKRKSMFALNL